MFYAFKPTGAEEAGVTSGLHCTDCHPVSAGDRGGRVHCRLQVCHPAQIQDTW